MPVLMTSLKRAPNGDWFSRKAIPEDVRDAYQRAHGVSREERFRRPGSLSQDRAKQEFREWDATVSGRIGSLRAAVKGEGQSLTPRQVHELAAQWYVWFVAQHESEPGQPEQWEELHERLQGAYERFSDGRLDDREDGVEISPRAVANVRRYVRAKVSELAQVPTFLAVRAVKLASETENALLDAVETEFVASLALLRRRASNDWGPDRHLSSNGARAPLVNSSPQRPADLTCWSLFEAWVKERQPGVSTINRWRSVFMALEKEFNGRDISAISNDEAIAWKDSLVTEKRSATVANGIWLVAARTVFGWALDNRKISSNPFVGVKVAAPRHAPKPRNREFNDAEWKVILSAALAEQPSRMASYNAAARRWVPWLCAYTGSRPGEMTQLRGVDVRKHVDAWVLHITPEAGHVKTGVARTVPIHEHLIEQGFVDFVKQQKGPLFYEPSAKRKHADDPTNPTRPASVKARQKLGDWVRGLGVTDRHISPNHGWRHTFKRRAARAQIEARIRNAMCGHATKTAGDDYETPTVEDLMVEMRKFPRYEL
jgi:integrase